MYSQEYLGKKTIKEIIHDENYIVTAVDIILTSIYLKIGIALIYRSRENYRVKVGHYTRKTYYIKNYQTKMQTNLKHFI